METARAARPEDLDDLTRLWRHAVDELDGQRGGTLLAGSLEQPDTAASVGEALEDPDRLLVVGFIDESPVGLASAVLRRARREPLAELQLIFVEPEARQVGVAEAMLDEVLAWAARHQVVGVEGPALPGNRPAKSFFEAHGFQARLLIMHRPLP